MSLVEAQAYEQMIDEAVVAAVTSGAITFHEILSALPSVYPSFALRSLERLTENGVLPASIFDAARVAATTPTTPTGMEGCGTGLPIPHPLDYEWRFSKQAVQHILNKCLALTGEGDTIALLGIPSVFHAAEHRRCHRSVFLLDANAAAIDHLTVSPRGPYVIHCDLEGDLLPEIRAKLVALDAPWYPDNTSAFLRAASQICVAGGYVLASIPPIGTRPGIEREWQGILREAERTGLKLLRLDTLAIPYLSPPFERNALRAEGITGFPSDWRRGNLAVFSSEKRETPSPSATVLRPEPWPEIAVDGVRIRVRPGDETAFADPTLVSLVPGDILPSVSRRDPRRQMADVWTSGNRVFGCNGPATLMHILRAMARKEQVAAALCQSLRQTLSGEEQQLVAQAVCQLGQLIRTEQNENLSYGY